MSVSSPRVLLADADADIRALYRQRLVATGCEVVEVGDGRDALVTALVRVPSLLLTELQLPRIDGMTMCEILRGDRMTADIPILVVTGEQNPATLDRARMLRSTTVLPKPADAECVVDEVERLLGRRMDLDEHSARAGERVARVLQESIKLSALSPDPRRRSRVTTSPPAPPLADLTCPLCGLPLTYVWSHTGGVSTRPEQWDEFLCSGACGTFEYRHRTRKLRRRA
jgi:CheY-like chemotaxis protein